VLDVAAEVLVAVRRAKTEAKASMRAPVTRVAVRDTAERIASLEAARADLMDAGKIEALDADHGAQLEVDITLASPDGQSA
jgi:valyl-tRNA synthetase